MREIVLFLTLLFAACTAQAQTGGKGLWTPAVGAKWVYQGVSLGGPFELRMTYAGDTIISGQTCQMLRLGSTTTSKLYTRATADQVFAYVGGQWYKLYDFSAQPGTSWTTLDAFLLTGCPRSITVTVDSVGQKIVGGQMRRWFKASYQITYPASPPTTQTWGRIYEGMGPLSGFINLTAVSSYACGVIEAGIANLLCYSPDGRSNAYVYNPSLNSYCNAILATAPAVRLPAELAVYPNPSTGNVTLDLQASYAAAAVEVLDLTGRLVWTGTLPANQQLDLRHLPKGLFLLRVQAANQPMLTRRIVLQ